MVASLLIAVSPAALATGVRLALLNKPKARRECSQRCPRRSLETQAQKRLIELGLMQGLIDCFLIFFLMAHSSDDFGPDLMLARILLRCLTRPQALGLSSIGVDLDLGLRSIIEAKFGKTLDQLFEDFDLPNENGMWTHEQVRAPRPAPRPPHPTPRATRPASRATRHADTRHVPCSTLDQILRVVLRYGLMLHAFPWYVVLWAACFFGMVRTYPWRAPTAVMRCINC